MDWALSLGSACTCLLEALPGGPTSAKPRKLLTQLREMLLRVPLQETPEPAPVPHGLHGLREAWRQLKMTRDTLRHHMEALLAHEEATKLNGPYYLLHPVSPAFNIHAPLPPPPPAPSHTQHLPFVAFCSDFLRTAPDLGPAFARWMTRGSRATWATVDWTLLMTFATDTLQDLRSWQSDIDQGKGSVRVTNAWANALHTHLSVIWDWCPSLCPTLSPFVPFTQSYATPEFENAAGICLPELTWVDSACTWDLSTAPIEHRLREMWDSDRDFTAVAVLPANVSPAEFAPHASDTRQFYTHPMTMPFPMSRIGETSVNPHDLPLVRVWACGRGTFTPQWMPLLNALTPLTGLSKAWQVPQSSPEHRPPLQHSMTNGLQSLSDLHDVFDEMWSNEVETRRTAMAPRWVQRSRRIVCRKNWRDVLESWDRVNACLHTSKHKHIKKIHSMRLCHTSVFEEGCFIYALWCVADGRIYIGQTGGRGKYRAPGEKGKEHLRAGGDFLRFWESHSLGLPTDVYRWVAQRGLENFILTPLEHTCPQWVDQREQWWMRRWGVGGLMNRAVPPLSTEKWSFLLKRKVWKQELRSLGGNLVTRANAIVAQGRPLHPNQLAPPLMLSLLSSTDGLIPPGDHRILYDKINQCFLRHYRVGFPYRLTLKLPLLSKGQKSDLKRELSGIISACDFWPTHLQCYIKDRLKIVACRTCRVSDVLRTVAYTKYPTGFLTLQEGDTCPCHRLRGVDGVAFVQGHAIFRDPEILSACAPGVDTSVYKQNMKNVCVPSWRRYERIIQDSLNSLSVAWPDHRHDLTQRVLSPIVNACSEPYQALKHSTSKSVFAPHLRAQHNKMPPWLVMEVFDKGVEVPSFACIHLWKAKQSQTFLENQRFQEVLRLQSREDACFWLYWRLVDSFSLTTKGQYSRFSVLRERSPLPHSEALQAFRGFHQHPPSNAVSRLTSELVSVAEQKLLKASPTIIPGPVLSTHAHSLLTKREMKEGARDSAEGRAPEGGRGRGRAREASRPRARQLTPRERRRSTAREPRDLSTPASRKPQSATSALRVLQQCSNLRVREEERPDAACPAIGLRNDSACAGVPDALLLFKHKMQEHASPPVVKAREVMRQARHPFRRYAKLFSRCLTVLWKRAAKLPDSTEFVSMRELRSVILKWEAKDSGPGVAWGELDVEEMFPNIRRSEVAQAVQAIFSEVTRGARIPTHEAFFKIHKGGVKRMDGIARKTRDNAFQFVPMGDLLNFLWFELWSNGQFVHFSFVFRQRTGVAIGGCTSAQTASLSVMYREKALDRSQIPPTARYRDNILVRLRADASGVTPQDALERTQRAYAAATGLTFTVENCSSRIQFLDVELGWEPSGTPTLNVKRPCFSEIPGQPNPPANKRLLDAHSPTASTMLQSYIPACMKHCAHNAIPVSQYPENVSRVATLCLAKLYPPSWWRPMVLRHADRIGKLKEPVQGLAGSYNSGV